MQLTDQMLAEIGAIKTRSFHIADEIMNPMLNPMVFESCSRGRELEIEKELVMEARGRKFRAFIAELNPYKVRLENILCETDVKE